MVKFQDVTDVMSYRRARALWAYTRMKQEHHATGLLPMSEKAVPKTHETTRWDNSDTRDRRHWPIRNTHLVAISQPFHTVIPSDNTYPRSHVL